MNPSTNSSANRLLDARAQRILLWTGLVGLLGAILVGIGEFLIQYTPAGGYEDPKYRFFVGIDRDRLTLGHFFSTLAAPLYIVGYWHLGQMFVRGGSRFSGWLITFAGGYAFMVGNAWLGGRIYLALLAKEIDSTVDPTVRGSLDALLADFSAHNEPLVNTLRIALVLISLLWIWRIWIGRTLYPRGYVVLNPALILASIFAAYFIGLPLAGYALPIAANVTHAVVFGASVIAVLRLSPSPDAKA